jgi:hypothetical protein
MDFGDVASVIFFLLIVASFLLPRLGRLGQRVVRDTDRGRSLRPTSLSESGGYERPARQTTASAPLPRGEGFAEEVGTARNVRRASAGLSHELDESRLTREEALERGPGAGARPTAEEQQRRTPRPASSVTPVTPRSERIRQQFANPQAVQAAFVLREVLDRPVGLRDGS